MQDFSYADNQQNHPVLSNQNNQIFDTITKSNFSYQDEQQILFQLKKELDDFPIISYSQFCFLINADLVSQQNIKKAKQSNANAQQNLTSTIENEETQGFTQYFQQIYEWHYHSNIILAKCILNEKKFNFLRKQISTNKDPQIKEKLKYLIKLSAISQSFEMTSSNSFELYSLFKLQIQQVDFSNINISQISLRQCFQDCNFQNAIFNNVKLNQCSFQNCNLQQAKFLNIVSNTICTKTAWDFYLLHKNKFLSTLSKKKNLLLTNYIKQNLITNRFYLKGQLHFWKIMETKFSHLNFILTSQGYLYINIYQRNKILKKPFFINSTLEVSKDSTLIAYGTTGAIYLYSSQDLKKLGALNYEANVRRIQFSQNNKLLIALYHWEAIVVWNVQNLQESLFLNAYQGSINSIQFLSNSQSIICLDGKKLIKWSSLQKSDESIHQLAIQELDKFVEQINENFLAIYGSQQISIFNIDNLSIQLTIKGFQKNVLKAKFSTDLCLLFVHLENSLIWLINFNKQLLEIRNNNNAQNVLSVCINQIELINCQTQNTEFRNSEEINLQDKQR